MTSEISNQQSGRAPSEISNQKSEIHPQTGFQIRAGQREFERGVTQHRLCALLARRQYGKTTLVSRIALKKMMKTPGHTVIFGSVKLDLGREIVRKESEVIYKAILAAGSAGVSPASSQIQLADTHTGKPIPITINADDFAELYEATRLEFRFYHSNTIYSRTKVVALTPDAVGETGDLILDEVGRTKRFREVMEAMKPIIASNPNFRCIFTTTPPPDDTHYSHELLAPPITAQFPINPKGNWYLSEHRINVLRLSADDAYADGIPLYDDDTGKPISPAESRAKEFDKDAWDRNYAIRFTIGGTAACSLMLLDTAQRRGIGQCAHFHIESGLDFANALSWLIEHLGPGKIGLGWDLATTEKATSNPSAFAVCEQSGQEIIVRAIFTWKTTDPAIAMERSTRIIQAISARKSGGRPRRLCIDATNERYFAQDARKKLAPLVPVQLVIASESINLPGQEPTNYKQYQGSLLVATLDDNHLTLPPERYIRDDFRLVIKSKGTFICEPDALGRHGDTFDAVKNALFPLISKSGQFEGGAVTPKTANEPDPNDDNRHPMCRHSTPESTINL